MDIGPVTGGTVRARFRDTPEYRRITEMISELVDLSARVERGACAGPGDTVDPGGIPPPDRARASSRAPSAHAESIDHTTREMCGPVEKRKKKKNRRKAGGIGPENLPIKKSELIERSRRDTVPYRSIESDRRTSAAGAPVIQESKSAWTTVVRKGRRGGGPSASAESRMQQARTGGLVLLALEDDNNNRGQLIVRLAERCPRPRR